MPRLSHAPCRANDEVVRPPLPCMLFGLTGRTPRQLAGVWSGGGRPLLGDDVCEQGNASGGEARPAAAGQWVCCAGTWA